MNADRPPCPPGAHRLRVFSAVADVRVFRAPPRVDGCLCLRLHRLSRRHRRLRRRLLRLLPQHVGLRQRRGGAAGRDSHGSSRERSQRNLSRILPGDIYIYIYIYIYIHMYIYIYIGCVLSRAQSAESASDTTRCVYINK